MAAAVSEAGVQAPGEGVGVSAVENKHRNVQAESVAVTDPHVGSAASGQPESMEPTESEVRASEEPGHPQAQRGDADITPVDPVESIVQHDARTNVEAKQDEPVKQEHPATHPPREPEVASKVAPKLTEQNMRQDIRQDEQDDDDDEEAEDYGEEEEVEAEDEDEDEDEGDEEEEEKKKAQAEHGRKSKTKAARSAHSQATSNGSRTSPGRQKQRKYVTVPDVPDRLLRPTQSAAIRSGMVSVPVSKNTWHSPTNQKKVRSEPTSVFRGEVYGKKEPPKPGEVEERLRFDPDAEVQEVFLSVVKQEHKKRLRKTTVPRYMESTAAASIRTGEYALPPRVGWQTAASLEEHARRNHKHRFSTGSIRDPRALLHIRSRSQGKKLSAARLKELAKPKEPEAPAPVPVPAKRPLKRRSKSTFALTERLYRPRPRHDVPDSVVPQQKKKRVKKLRKGSHTARPARRANKKRAALKDAFDDVPPPPPPFQDDESFMALVGQLETDISKVDAEVQAAEPSQKPPPVPPRDSDATRVPAPPRALTAAARRQLSGVWDADGRMQ